jgi:phosphoglycerate dehydrogenase-like enzyme
MGMANGDRERAALRIAVLDDYQQIAATLGAWDTVPRTVELDAMADHIDDLSALVERLGGAEVVVAMRERTPLTAEVIGALPDLRLIVTTGPSNAVIDVAAAHANDVEVRGTGGYLSPTSELTWALILALLRHVPAEDRSVREGGWQHTLGTELAGRTLGVVGLGRLGTLVARVGAAFDMKVIAWSQNLDPDHAAELGVTAVGREELFSTADVVSVHLVLSDRSRGLVGAADIDRMKPTAILVNTSRGPIVDEAALVAALESGAIAGAGLDVFDHEPLPLDHPFRRLDNTVLTPHIGYVSDGLYELFYAEIVEDIAAWCRGETLRVVEP